MNQGDTLIRRFKKTVDTYREQPALFSKEGGREFQQFTYADLFADVCAAAAALAELGITRGDHIGILSDNRREWLITDLAILTLGAVDVPRGADSTPDEFSYILTHSDSTAAFVENRAQLEKVASRKEKLSGLKYLICYDEPGEMELTGIEILSFAVLLEKGRAAGAGEEFFNNAIKSSSIDDVVTLIYTSGTTGEPKGVMLTNRSYIFQLERIYKPIPICPGERFFSVLPSWHSYERAIEYIVINRGASIIYSKPIGSIMLADMAATNPHWMTSVPRIWEAIRAAVLRNINQGSNLKKSLFYFFLTVGQSHYTLLTMLRGLMPQFRKRIIALDRSLALGPFLLLTPFKLLGDLLVFGKIKKSWAETSGPAFPAAEPSPLTWTGFFKQLAYVYLKATD